MIVKCPQCATGYSIPENLVGEKPKKMRCSRCKNVFTLMRRHDKAPTGYEEFTGEQHLPQEFAFLRSAPPAEAPVAAPQADAGPAPEQAAPVEPQPDAAAGAEAAVPDAAPAPVAPPVSSAYYAGRHGAAPPPAPAPIHEEWEEEVPLELSGYTISIETKSRGAQAFGKFVFVVLIALVGLFVFVLYRNDWSLSMSELGSQISNAFSGQKRERIPEEARSLDAVVSARKLLTASSGAKYLVVTGDVFNRGFTGLSRIVLKGRLTAGAGETIAEVRAPCGKTIDDETIKMTAKGAMGGHFRTREGALYNCVISADGSTTFQLVFDDIPPDYGSSTLLEVTAVSAQLAD